MPRRIRQARLSSITCLVLGACVSPDLHCGQPSRDETRRLEATGIAPVVNLREHHSHVARAEGTQLTIVEAPLDAGDSDHDDSVCALAFGG